MAVPRSRDGSLLAEDDWLVDEGDVGQGNRAGRHPHDHMAPKPEQDVIIHSDQGGAVQ